MNLKIVYLAKLFEKFNKCPLGDFLGINSTEDRVLMRDKNQFLAYPEKRIYQKIKLYDNRITIEILTYIRGVAIK